MKKVAKKKKGKIKLKARSKITRPNFLTNMELDKITITDEGATNPIVIDAKNVITGVKGTKTDGTEVDLVLAGTPGATPQEIQITLGEPVVFKEKTK